MGSDKLGRTKGYKKIVSVGMEVEQPGALMGTGRMRMTGSNIGPAWMKDVNADMTSWIKDGSGPYEFSFMPAMKNMTEIFVKFAEGVPDHKKWRWVSQYGGRNYLDTYSDTIGCGSHVHLGLMQGNVDDRRTTSLIQNTILWNTSVTFLPFTGKYLGWTPEDRLRNRTMFYASLESKCRRYNPTTMADKMRRATGRENEFITLNRNGKEKMTMEIRAVEAMPQWVLPFIDVFLLMAYKHIEVGESPKLINHRAVMRWLHNQYDIYGKITDLDYIIEFEKGKELYAPVPHIIGEKFPRVMTAGEFLHLIDNINYWIFSYSSRAYYWKQLRFRALGGQPSRLPVPMMWRPWKYTVKEMFEATGQSHRFMTARTAKKSKFPKTQQRTHSPFAQVRLGKNRTPSESENEAAEITNSGHETAGDILASLIEDTLHEAEPNQLDMLIDSSTHARIYDRARHEVLAARTDSTDTIPLSLPRLPTVYTYIELDHHDGICDECNAIHVVMMEGNVLGSTGNEIACTTCIMTRKCIHGNKFGDGLCILCSAEHLTCIIHNGEGDSRCVGCIQTGYRKYMKWSERTLSIVAEERASSLQIVYGDTDSIRVGMVRHPGETDVQLRERILASRGWQTEYQNNPVDEED